MSAELFRVNPEPGKPGLYLDQITIVFKEGTTRADVDAVNAPINATVLIAPKLSRAYRIKLHPSWSLDLAAIYYSTRPEVQGALPATDYAFDSVSPSEVQVNDILMNLPSAWAALEAEGRPLGSRNVRVAIIDNQIDVAHKDLINNLAINQGEIPAFPSFNQVQDVPPKDGLITFFDLNDPLNADFMPADINGNLYVDGEDLVQSPLWSDGNDDDLNGKVDDLVGWNFNGLSEEESNSPLNYPLHEEHPHDHGTQVAGLVGAEGGNNNGITGASPIVSIVPLVAGRGELLPDVDFIEALTYAELLGVDIVVASVGWQLASDDADLRCVVSRDQDDAHLTKGIPAGSFPALRAFGERAFDGPPFTDGQGNVTSRMLYVLSAGNNHMNLADPGIIKMPQQLMKGVMGKHVLIVGATESGPLPVNVFDSNYGEGVVEIWAPTAWTTTSILPRAPAGHGPGAVIQGDGFTTTSGFRGTSASCPAVAGVAALVLSRFPELIGDPVALHDHLVSTASNIVTVTTCLLRPPPASNQPFVNALSAVVVQP